MSVLSSIVECPDLQIPLDTVFRGYSPTRVMESHGVIQFLNSAINRAGFEQIGTKVSPGNGKRRDVEVRFIPRVPEDVVHEGRVDTCESTREIGDTTAVYSIDPDTYTLKADFKVNRRLLETSCLDNPMWLQERLVAEMNALERAAWTFVLDQMTTQYGTFYDKNSLDTANTKTVQTKDSSGNNLQTLIEEVTYNSDRNLYGGAPFLFGHGELYKYMKRVAAGCCLQTGLDLATYASQNALTFLPDAKVENAFGTGSFITLAPGAVQLIYFNEFDGAYPNSLESGDKVRRVVRGMFTGIPIDLKMDETCSGGTDVVSVFLSVCLKAVTMPTDMFGNDPNLAGQVNFNKYQITNPT